MIKIGIIVLLSLTMINTVLKLSTINMRVRIAYVVLFAMVGYVFSRELPYHNIRQILSFSKPMMTLLGFIIIVDALFSISYCLSSVSESTHSALVRLRNHISHYYPCLGSLFSIYVASAYAISSFSDIGFNTLPIIIAGLTIVVLWLPSFLITMFIPESTAEDIIYRLNILNVIILVLVYGNIN